MHEILGSILRTGCNPSNQEGGEDAIKIVRPLTLSQEARATVKTQESYLEPSGFVILEPYPRTT